MRIMHKCPAGSLLILTSCMYSDYTPYTDSEENASDHFSRVTGLVLGETWLREGDASALHRRPRHETAAQKWGNI